MLFSRHSSVKHWTRDNYFCPGKYANIAKNIFLLSMSKADTCQGLFYEKYGREVPVLS